MAEPTCDVLVVGGINTDYLGRGDALPKSGETVNGDTFLESPGGKGANQAVTAVRLGARVRLVGAVGKDDRGHRLMVHLREEGVDATGVVEIPGAITGAALILVDGQGENQILAVLGANRHLLVTHLEAVSASLTHAQVVLAQLEVSLSCVQAAFTWGRRVGARCILDPAPAVPLPDALLQDLDVIRPNAREAEVLTGIRVHDLHTARKAAKRLRERGVRAVIVQAGNQGNLLVFDEGEHWMPLLPVETVDATGAGDAFAGTLAAYLAKGRSLVDASTLANAAAALATTELGAQAPRVTEAELLALLSHARA